MHYHRCGAWFYGTKTAFAFTMSQAGRTMANRSCLLHGFPQSWVMWRRVWAALAERHRVIAVDLRGYGEFGQAAGC